MGGIGVAVRRLLRAAEHGGPPLVPGHRSRDKVLKSATLACLLIATISLFGTVTSPVATAAEAGHIIPDVGCASNTPAYPGSRPTDCVALGNNTVFVDDTVVSARWSLTADEFGFTNLCADVSIRNLNTSAYFFNDFNMTMRPPKGKVTVLNFTAKHALNEGYIAPGGIARGGICFDYFGRTGQYVAMYSPRPLSSIRGIWLVNIN